MATRLEQAQRGQRKAMLEVYEGCKQKVYYVSLLLTGQEDGAKQAAAYAGKQVWDSMKLYPICTQEDFTHLAIQKAVESCKRIILKHQPKAFRIPQNRNFLISGELVTSGQPQALLQALPPLSRFLLVLHTVGGYNQQQLATAFKLDAKTVASAHFTSDEDPAATATPTTTDEDASATETTTSDETADTYTPAALESGVTYTAQIEVEDYGTITILTDA